jgi:hypothetical protein
MIKILLRKIIDSMGTGVVNVTVRGIAYKVVIIRDYGDD